MTGRSDVATAAASRDNTWFAADGTGRRASPVRPTCLFVCHRLPIPPSDGARVRAFNVIRHLSLTYDLTVATIARSPEELAASDGLREFCRHVVVDRVTRPAAVMRMMGSVFTPTPASMRYFHAPGLATRLRELTRSTVYDLIYVYSSSVAPYVQDAPAGLRMLDFVDIDSQKWLAYATVKPFPMSAVYRLEGHKLQRAERDYASQFDLCTCITPAELDSLRKFGAPCTADWFPNGVDLEYFSPGAEPPAPDSICFVGRMDYFPNQRAVISFCSDILPRLRQRRPDVTFSIVGADPPQTIRRLARLPGVSVTGTVPDVRPHVRRCMLSVVPLDIARGTQNKILESMAMGVPVVASSRAAAGVDAVPSRHLFATDSPEEFAAIILDLLADEPRRREVARSARAHVEHIYNWPRALARLSTLIEEASHARRRLVSR